MLGKVDDKNFSIHISKIKKVFILNTTFDFSNDEIKLFDEIVFNGIQFHYQEACLAEIKLNKYGKKTYERRYLHRPSVKK